MSVSVKLPASLAAVLLFVSSVCHAVEPIPVTQKAYGKTYAQFAAGWLEWALAIPVSTNPILDNDGSYGAIGQSGKVWYLAGNSGGTTTRSLTVPSGTALFFPLVNYFWVNTPETGDPAWSPAWEASVRQSLAARIDGAHSLSLEVDGVPSATVQSLRVASRVGTCVLPTENIVSPDVNPGPHECVGDGYWALLEPLQVGQHTIRFTGSTDGFSLDVTYNVTVKQRQKL
jgi:hypothetical protein